MGFDDTGSEEPFRCICVCGRSISEREKEVERGGTKYAFSKAGVGVGVLRTGAPELTTPGSVGSLEVGGEPDGGVGGCDAAIAVTTEVSLLLRGITDCHS